MVEEEEGMERGQKGGGEDGKRRTEKGRREVRRTEAERRKKGRSQAPAGGSCP